MKRRRGLIYAVVTFLMVGIVLSGLYILVRRQSIANNQERYRYIAASQANNIRDCIDKVLARAYTFSALVSDNQGDVSFFDVQGGRIYQEAKDEAGVALKNVALAPGGVVEKVYPLTGNESLIGFNFMDADKAGNAEAIAAFERGEMIITNPFRLVQGGVGMAGRLPVFLDRDGVSEFWGLVTVTMDFDDLLAAFNMTTLTNMGVNYELWYQDAEGARVVLDASVHAPANAVCYEIVIENLVWRLDVSPADGWVDYVEAAVVFCVIFAFALLAALLLLNQEQVKTANEKLQRLAHLDSLTSCYSRHYVNTILLNPRNGAWNEPNVKFSLAMIDIDNFKSINDTFGHELGDRAIIAVAKVLQDNSNHADGDCVIRFGGDEFIVLFNDVTRERFVKKLEAIVADVREIRFPDAPALRLTVSVGGQYGPEEGRADYYGLLRSADEHLYRAKEAGRDRYVLECEADKEH